MGSSPQRSRIFLLRNLVSFSGCSAATQIRNSSSKLTGINSSVWQRAKKRQTMSLNYLEGKRNLSCNLSPFFFFSIYNGLYQVVCTYQVKHRHLFVVSSHGRKFGFDLGFYIALVSSKEADSSHSLHQITEMPCLHSRLCDFAKHTEGLSWATLGSENKDKLTHNLKVMNFHSFLSSTPGFKSLKIVVRINFHGALPHLPVDVHTVMNIINLAAFKVGC